LYFDITQIDTLGNTLFDTSEYTPTSGTGINKAFEDSSGFLYLTGTNYCDTILPDSCSYYDIRVVKMKVLDGLIIWDKKFRRTIGNKYKYDKGISIICKDSIVYVGADCQKEEGKYDYYLLLLNANTGDTLKTLTFDSKISGDDHLYSIAVSENNDIVLCGMSKSLLNKNVITTVFYNDKQDTITNIKEMINVAGTIYPNPAYAGQKLTISYDFDRFELTNISGVKLISGSVASEIITSELKTGIYLLFLYKNETVIIEKLIIY
jgi:hypothetical protein